jgi:6-phosphofructokinase
MSGPAQAPARPIRRAAILFAGGPAPGANAVISTAAASFLRNDLEVVGILNGYSNLEKFDAVSRPLREGEDYVPLTQDRLRRTRNTRGILLGTARTNPGRNVNSPADLADETKSAPLRTVHAGLASLGVDALVSIGGDDTLKTANKLRMLQDHLPEGSRRIAVVHVPKTIDNDYLGIDFTFGYFTAVETLASEIRNLLADAEATRSYYLAETMGRSAGWLAYGAAIAGEASLVMSVEDIIGRYRTTEVVTDPETGKQSTRSVMDVTEVVRHIVAAMRARDRLGKPFGVIVIAEGLAEHLPFDYLREVSRDEHGHVAISQVELGRTFANEIAREYKAETGQTRRLMHVKLGYEARCAAPHAFDVMLGSQLGVGAYRALVEEGLDGVMVSVSGQLELNYVPFEQLVNPETLVTVVRRIPLDSDFHRLARFLETEVDE